MTDAPRTGRVIIDWVDASEERQPPEAFNFGWSIRSEPPLDDARLAALLSEIADRI